MITNLRDYTDYAIIIDSLINFMINDSRCGNRGRILENIPPIADTIARFNKIELYEDEEYNGSPILYCSKIVNKVTILYIKTQKAFDVESFTLSNQEIVTIIYVPDVVNHLTMKEICTGIYSLISKLINYSEYDSSISKLEKMFLDYCTVYAMNELYNNSKEIKENLCIKSENDSYIKFIYECIDKYASGNNFINSCNNLFGICEIFNLINKSDIY